MKSQRSKKKVCILLCTFNGEKFLSEQLDSIYSQTHKNWVVFASDDGSSDSTLDILKYYQKIWPPGTLKIRAGKQKGFAHNFLSLACDPKINGDYYAFCDQDDIWLPSKLEIAIQNISKNSASDELYLYCGRTHYVSDKIKSLRDSPLFPYPRSFRNALVQSIAGGNTMLFNQPIKSVFEITGILEVPSHDWWLYLLVEALGGKVFYDPIPYILYRQHSSSLVGSCDSVPAKFKRFVLLMQNRFKYWNDLHINALDKVKFMMTNECKDVLAQFVRLRNSNLLHRLRMIEVCGLYRQGWRGALSLYIAAIFNKM